MESPVCTPTGSTFSIGADDHDVVVAVAHELELEFLPALDALFDQDFVGGRVMDAGAGDAVQLLLVVGDAGAQARPW